MKCIPRYIFIGILITLIPVTDLRSQGNNYTCSIKLFVLDSLSNQRIAPDSISIISQGGEKINLVERNGELFLTVNMYRNLNDLTIAVSGFKSASFRLNCSGNTTMAEVTVKMLPLNLDTVYVTARRKLVHFDNDKVWFDVKSDSSLRGKSTLDAFAKLPFTYVYNRQIRMVESQKRFFVTVDGRRTSQVALNLSDALEVIPAYEIDRIELFDPAPLRYQQQGFQVLFNIVTKSGLQKGVSFNGNGSAGTLETNLTASGGMNNRHFDGAFRTSYANEWLNTDGQLVLNNPDQGLNANSTGFRRSIRQSVAVDVGHRLKEWGDFSLVSSVDLNKFSNTIQTVTIENFPVSKIYSSMNDFQQRLPNLSAAAGWYRKAIGAEYSVSMLLQRTEDERENWLTENFAASDLGVITNRTGSGLYLLALLQMDYVKVLKRGQRLELTMKAASRKFQYAGQGFQKADTSNAPAIVTPGAEYSHVIKQQILYPTIRYSRSIKKVRIIGAVTTDLFSNEVVDNSLNRPVTYFNIIPAINGIVQVSKRSQMSAGFSGVLRRNSYFDLNPFLRQFTNAIGEVGNIGLPFQITQFFQLDWRYYSKRNNSFRINFLHTQTEKAITRNVVEADSGTTVASFAEAKRRLNALYFSGTVSILKNLQFSFNSAVGYQKVLAAGLSQNAEVFYSFSPVVVWNITKPKMTVGFNGFFNSVNVNVNTVSRGTQLNDLFVSKQIFNNRLTASISVIDPVNLNAKQFERTKGGSLFLENKAIRSSRAVSLSFSYSFSKNNQGSKVRKTNISNNDILRQ